MKNLALVLFAGCVFTGCTTVTKYEPMTTAGPAKPADYPVYVYTEQMKVPRQFEVIGTMRVSDTPFTVMGGSLEGVLKTLRQNARKNGADAVHLRSVKQPGFTSANYGADASFLRFTDMWESVTITDSELASYLQAKAQPLDPIEGIWLANDPLQTQVAIIKNESKAGRDFVALILSTKNAAWKRGDKKLDLVRGERPGVYRGNYYFDDYRSKPVAFTLRVPPAERFMIQMADEGAPLIFVREQRHE